MRILLAVVAYIATAGHAAAQSAGEYLFHAAGCAGCHTREYGPALAGGRAFATPYGTFYSPNITPDVDTGIGDWTLEEFSDALKHGVSPSGDAYYPVFPYPSYRGMRDDDVAALFDYLKTREPFAQPNRKHDVPWWLARWMMYPWQWWLLEPPAPPPADPALARGHYLVDVLGHCGECHTPRKLAGLSDRHRYLAGTLDGPDGEKVPNITPQRDDGIGKWSADDLAYFLETGALPDGDYTGSVMSEVIDNTTSQLTKADRMAIVRYLMAQKAVAGP